MKNNKKKIFVAGLALAMSAGLLQNTFACTGVIVGKDLTKDGSFIYGRTEDYERNRTMRLVTHPRGEFKKGDKLVDVNNGFEYIHPEDSLKFFSTPDSTKKPKDMEQGVYDAAGYNEAGVGIFCTVSADCSDEIAKVDPYVKNGVNEASMTTFLLAHAKSAKGAIELLAKTIDEKGASMGDIVAFGDKNEVWYMEIYSGHQYVAIKYPKDKFSVFPNAFWLGGVDLNDKENVICSKDVIKVAKDAGTYVETKDGLIDLSESYNPKELRDSNRSRIYSGIKHLDPNSKIKYDDKDFPLLNSLTEKSEKIDVKDVLNLLRNRLENTEFKAADTRKDMKDDKTKYPIGNINTMQAHIFQIKDDYPDKAPGVMWMTLGSPLNIPFVPVFPDINDSSEQAKLDAPTYDKNSLYWVGSSVNDLVTVNRNELGKESSKKINEFEDEIMKEFAGYEKEWKELYKKNPEEAAKFSTEKTMEFTDKVFKFEQELAKEFSKSSKVDLINHWSKEAVLDLLKKDMVIGADDLNYYPDKEITVEEFISIIAKGEKIDKDSVKWAEDNKLFRGIEKYNVKDNITREEMAVITANYLNTFANKNFDSKTELTFKDNEEIAAWAQESVKNLVGENIIKGKGDNKFAPKETLTRGEAAQIIHNISK